MNFFREIPTFFDDKNIISSPKKQSISKYGNYVGKIRDKTQIMV